MMSSACLHGAVVLDRLSDCVMASRYSPVTLVLKDFIRRMHDTQKLIDEYECGQLMKSSTHFEVLDKIQAEKQAVQLVTGSEKYAQLQ